MPALTVMEAPALKAPERASVPAPPLVKAPFLRAESDQVRTVAASVTLTLAAPASKKRLRVVDSEPPV